MSERVVCPICGRYVHLFGSGSLSRHSASKINGKSMDCSASWKTYSFIRNEESRKRREQGLEQGPERVEGSV